MPLHVCFQVDAKPLRAELIPVTTAALERIKLLLLNMARDATLAALEDLRSRIAMLQQRPASLDEYMSYQVRPLLLVWLLALCEGRTLGSCM